MSDQEERCTLCDETTGRAGKGEDSLYTEDDRGPFCEKCWDSLPPPTPEQQENTDG